MARNAVFLASDDTLLPVATWLWLTLSAMNPRDDTDVILISEKRHRSFWGTPVPEGCSIAADDLQLPKLDYPTKRRIPVATYWRVAVPAYLAQTYRRLLYLDIDILPVDVSLFDCFDYEMGSAPLAACHNLPHLRARRQSGGGFMVGKFPFDRYFNAGVLLIDIANYDRHGIADRTYRAIEEHGQELRHNDQTALNLAAEGNWVDLSPRYNFPPGALRTFLARDLPPKIIHYYGISKPWHLLTRHAKHPMRLKLLHALLRHGGGGLMLRDIARGLFGKESTAEIRYMHEQNEQLMQYLAETSFIDVNR